MSIPGQIIFIFVADVIHMGESTIGILFVAAYLFVSIIQVSRSSIDPQLFIKMIVTSSMNLTKKNCFLQVCLLLYIAHVLVHAMWRWKVDPDNSAIPYLTALGDLFGSMLLALAFLFLQGVGHGYGEADIQKIGP